MRSQVTNLFESKSENLIQAVIPDEIKLQFDTIIYNYIVENYSQYFENVGSKYMLTKTEFLNQLNENNFHHDAHIKLIHDKYVITNSGAVIILQILLPYQILTELESMMQETIDFTQLNNHLHIHNISARKAIEIQDNYSMNDIDILKKSLPKIDETACVSYNQNLFEISELLEEYCELIENKNNEKKDIRDIFNAFKFSSFSAIKSLVLDQENLKHYFNKAQNASVGHIREMLNELELGNHTNNQDPIEEEIHSHNGEIKTSKLREYFSKILSKILQK